MSEAARNVAAIKSDGKGTKSVHELIESPDFKHLVKKRWSVSLVLLALLFVTYYGYVLIIGADKTIFAQRIGEATTLGIPVGQAVIVFAWILTAYYVGWANKSYDPEVERLKGQLLHK